MNFSECISQLLSSTEYGSRDQALKSVKNWAGQDIILYVSNVKLYFDSLENIYKFNRTISSRFSRETVFNLINDQIPKLKAEGEGNVEFEEFFETLLSLVPRNFRITSPISGIRLDGVTELSIPPYKFGYLKDVEGPISNENGHYISVEIRNLYDEKIAISKAENAFLDFARLIVFISGKLDGSIRISTGLPLMPSYSHELMYVNTSSYQVIDERGGWDSSYFSNKIIDKIPVNIDFFCKNKDFKRLWELNDGMINGSKLNDIDSRVINTALALGESALTTSKKNSIIYTCISLEIMFSSDEGALFQRSIGEKISDLFVFVVARDKDSRLKLSKMAKDVYAMRSAIVHGGNKELTDKNLEINSLMRTALSEILNNKKYGRLKSIGDLIEMLKEAQNSYL